MGSILIEQTDYTLSSLSFHILTWLFFALCIVAFAIRAYIRYVCFRRLFFEDYLILVALVLHSAEAVLIQIFVPILYDLEAVQNGDTSKIGPDFFSESRKGFISVGCGMLITLVGVLLVKLNFLFFFRRLGTNVQYFTILWWIVMLFTVAGTVAQIGTLLFGCFFGDVNYIFGQCATPENNRRVMINAIFSSVVDAVSDFFIVALPVTILWRSHLNMRKKLILMGIFSLAFITIAVTVVRGSIFHPSYDSNVSQSGAQKFQSLTFTWFWFYCEFTVAFLISCIVSFRSLFLRREKTSHDLLRERQRKESARQNALDKRWRIRLRNLHDSVLDTCRTLEGWPGSDEELNAMRTLPSVPSGLMTVDFSDDTNWNKSVRTVTRDGPAAADISIERTFSVRSFPRSPGTAHHK